MLAGFADEISVALAGKTAVTIIKGWTLSAGKAASNSCGEVVSFTGFAFTGLAVEPPPELAATRCGLVVTVGEGVQRVADKGVQRGRFVLGGDVLEVS